MIIVTGATGQLGSRVMDALLERTGSDRVGISVRDPGSVSKWAERGVRVRHGDFADPASLSSAFEGASQVLVVSSNVSGNEAVNQHKAAIDAAYSAGAARVLYTSHQASSVDSLFDPMRDHARTETYLGDQDAAFTALRNGYYASTVPMLIGQALNTGTIWAPADSPVSWTTHADLAEAAAVALTEPGRIDDISPALTAGEAHDLDAVAEMLSELTGRSITRVVATDDDYKNTLTSNGVPAEQAEFLLGMFRAARIGEFSTVDPTLSSLLGRAPTPLCSVLREVITARAVGRMS